jgi:hypothetical protein
MKIQILLDVTPGLAVNSRSCFDSAYCLRFQGIGLLDSDDVRTSRLRKVCTYLPIDMV